MKKLLTLLLISTSLTLVSCKEDDGSSRDQVDLFTYITFVVPGTSNDFFQSYENYQFGQVKFGNDGTENFGPTNFRKLDSMDIYIYEFIGWGGGQDVYARFGNGDIDTLHIAYEPASLRNALGGIYNGNIEWIEFYYNDELVETWDFEENPGLRDELLERNIWKYDAEPVNPIVIYLPKEPDPEEFD